MKRAAIVVACVLGAIGYWWPAFASPSATGFGDWQMVHHNWEVGRVAIERHHEWPVFDPYHCGGVTMLGNPESQIYSPLFLLSFALGTTLATKVFLSIHTAVALLGMFAYARRVVRAGVPAATLAAVVFAGSGFFAWHGAGGHATFASFAFLPLLHLFLREGERRAGSVVAAAALLALTVAEGGTYPYPYMLVSLALAVSARALESPRDGLFSLRALATMTVLSAGFAAYRLVPVVRTLARIPRTISGWDRGELGELVMMLTAREHEWRVEGHEFVWPEYATYVGVPVLVLAAIGVLSVASRSTRAGASRPAVLAHVAMGLVIAMLCLGNASDVHPWPLLRVLPVFDSLRVPSRFLVVLTFHLGALAAVGLDRLSAIRSPRSHRIARAIATLVVVGVAADVIVVTRPIVNRWDRPPIDTSIGADERTYLNVAYDATYASLPARNQSTTACYVGGMNWPVSPALRVGAVPFARTDDPSATVSLVNQTSSSHRIHYRAQRPVRIVLNQNFDPAFRASVGRTVESDGLLAIDLPSGERIVDVRYDGRDGLLGLAISTGFAIAAFALLRVARARTRRPRSAPKPPLARPILVRVAIAAALVLGYAGFAGAHRPAFTATASGVFDDAMEFEARNVLDGRIETEWLSTDGPTATLDVRFDAPRDVGRIALVNGHNRHFMDRGVRRFSIELFRAGVRVDRIEGSFDAVTNPGRRVVVGPRSPAVDIDRIRVDVAEVFGLGAALAEIEIR